MQGLAPATPILLLSVSPRSNDRPQGLKLLAGPLLIGVDGTPGGIAPSACFIPGYRGVPFDLVLSLGFRPGLVQGLFFLVEFSDFLLVDSVVLSARLGH